MEGKPSTIAALKRLVERGPAPYWFTPDTMRFFRTRIGVYRPGRVPGVAGWFVTSEQPPHEARGYAVRFALMDGTIETVGRTCEYATRDRAVREMLRLSKIENVDELDRELSGRVIRRDLRARLAGETGR